MLGKQFAERHACWLLAGILLLALGLRLGAAGGIDYLLQNRWHRDFLIEGDANGYWELAERIVDGEDYAIHEPPRYALRMPGFPAVIAGLMLVFGKSHLAVTMGLGAIGTLTCWLVYLLGKQMFGQTTGLLAAAIAAIAPVLVVFSVITLSETCFAATILLSLISGHRLMTLQSTQSPHPFPLAIQALITGFTIALGCYFRPSWILAAPILMAFQLLWSPRKITAAWTGGVVTAAMLLTLLPWGLRNQEVTGHFKLTTLWMGPSLYDGLNPQATGDSDMTFFDEERRPATMTEYEVDQHYKQRAIDFAKSNPGRVMELVWAKTIRYWKPWPNAAQFDSLWGRIAVSAIYLPMMIFAVWGTFVLIRQQIQISADQKTHSLQTTQFTSHLGIEKLPFPPSLFWTIAILAGPILYFAALHVVFVSSLRYRLPAEYPILILTAVGIQNFWYCWKGTAKSHRVDSLTNDQ